MNIKPRRTNIKDVHLLQEVGIPDFDFRINNRFETMLCKQLWFLSLKLLGSCSELDKEDAVNDTIAENDGFVTSNYDYVITLASMKTIEEWC